MDVAADNIPCLGSAGSDDQRHYFDSAAADAEAKNDNDVGNGGGDRQHWATPEADFHQNESVLEDFKWPCLSGEFG